MTPRRTPAEAVLVVHVSETIPDIILTNFISRKVARFSDIVLTKIIGRKSSCELPTNNFSQNYVGDACDLPSNKFSQNYVRNRLGHDSGHNFD